MRWRRRDDPPPEVAPTPPAVDAVADPLIPDADVLDELSRVFAHDEPSGAVTVVARAPEPTPPPASTPAGVPPPSRRTIAIGADDDLPDAVYLDDELSRSETGSGPVFIDDDGSNDALAPKDATVTGMEPRLRQRRIGVRRAAGRRRLWWALGGAAVLVVLVAAGALLGSSLFAVDEVVITGNVYTDPTALEAIVDDLVGTPVLLVDTSDYQARLESIPWVERARVRTRFPDRATIELTERTPEVAIAGTDGRSRVLDRFGRILAVIDGQPVALVWIDGPGVLDLGAGEQAPPGYAAAGALVTKLTPTIRAALESLSVVADGSDLVMHLAWPSGPVEVRFGSALGDNDQIEKLVRLERVLSGLGDRPVSAIDVSTAEVTVR